MIIEMPHFFTIFSFVNVACTIFLCRYLFKRFVIPTLVEQRLVEKRKVQHLKDERRRLEIECETIKREYEAQQRTGQWLLGKIEAWDKAAVRKEQEHQEAVHRSQVLLRHYLEDQASHLSREHARMEIVPEAIIEATKELKIFFSNDQEQKKFIECTLKILSDAS